jgi:iron complex outermembrane recepter protein
VTRVVGGNADPLRCPVTQALLDCRIVLQAYAGGNPELQPETSQQTNIGVVWQPLRELSLSLDHWRIRQEGVIAPLSAELVLRYPARFADRILRGPVEAAWPGLPGPIVGMNLSPINLGTTRLRGSDVALQWKPAAASWGRLGAAWRGTHVQRHETQFDGATFVSLLGNAKFAAPVPRWRSLASLDWDHGPWGATLSHAYSAGYSDQFPGADGQPRRVGATTQWDLQLRATAGERWQWSLTIENLFDRAPPASNQQRTAQSGYDPQLSNPVGRSAALRGVYVIK